MANIHTITLTDAFNEEDVVVDPRDIYRCESLRLANDNDGNPATLLVLLTGEQFPTALFPAMFVEHLVVREDPYVIMELSGLDIRCNVPLRTIVV